MSVTQDFNNGNSFVYSGGAGTNANDAVIQTVDVSRFDTFLLMSTAGAMQVLASLDGTNYCTAPLNMQDYGAVDNTPVIVTAANRVYGFRGKFKLLKITQNGATGVANAALTCGNLS